LFFVIGCEEPKTKITNIIITIIIVIVVVAAAVVVVVYNNGARTSNNQHKKHIRTGNAEMGKIDSCVDLEANSQEC